MEIIFTEVAKRDLDNWRRKENNKVLQKIRSLLENMLETPFSGIGNPEPLKYDFTGKWSRRITQVDRLVYSIQQNIIYIHSLKGHYY